MNAVAVTSWRGAALGSMVTAMTLETAVGNRGGDETGAQPLATIKNNITPNNALCFIRLHSRQPLRRQPFVEIRIGIRPIRRAKMIGIRIERETHVA